MESQIETVNDLINKLLDHKDKRILLYDGVSECQINIAIQNDGNGEYILLW